ncbi:MAG: His/Gly/Thr/Pro-type tRNA ligase C-terminal domain-containing protein, partial [Candidatus Thiodiazotropha weberae]|nr:His/Gly/Thr/Pro-type tRNA ligase C-terminal domain-containing protein [Candidatus Thiodiazotropha lotti]MCW4210088.1 His/Gly/Thr/Pro-type tRNA ligase C-terminal domain-containing protein [Candidatus Thiodiazotropha lotti]
VQAVLLNITDRQSEYLNQCHKSLRDNGFRVESDLRNEKIGFKIREHTLMRVPYLLVIGDREMEEGTVAVRTRTGEDLGSMPLSEFMERANAEVSQRVN